jgi:hypothetical protein
MRHENKAELYDKGVERRERGIPRPLPEQIKGGDKCGLLS